MNDFTLILDSLTEDTAISLVLAIEHRFGFTGTTFTRGDAEQEWQSQTDNDGDVLMPDDVWQRVQDTWSWNKMNETLCERGWDFVADAVQEAISNP